MTINQWITEARGRCEAATPGCWQPIASAPRDGTGVLLCWAISPYDGHVIDWEKNPTTAQVFVQAASWWSMEGDDGSGSWITYCHMVREPEVHFKPTHWMPLPSPPHKQSARTDLPKALEAIERLMQFVDHEDSLWGDPNNPAAQARADVERILTRAAGARVEKEHNDE